MVSGVPCVGRHRACHRVLRENPSFTFWRLPSLVAPTTLFSSPCKVVSSAFGTMEFGVSISCLPRADADRDTPTTRAELSVRHVGRGVGGFGGRKQFVCLKWASHFGSLFKVSFFPRGKLFWFWVGGWFGLRGGGGSARSKPPPPPSPVEKQQLHQGHSPLCIVDRSVIEDHESLD